MKTKPLLKMFWGRIELESSMSVFSFSKDSKIQNLIHSLKYKNNTKIGEILGVELGKELLKTDGFKKIDLIIPVPLHKRKERIRGFNQSYFIAKGVSKVLKAPVNKDILLRGAFNTSQTDKTRYDRWKNASNVFLTTNKNEKLNNKHILLIDDVITTGATIEGCVSALQHIKELKISVAALANS